MEYLSKTEGSFNQIKYSTQSLHSGNALHVFPRKITKSMITEKDSENNFQTEIDWQFKPFLNKTEIITTLVDI